ncbi:MAG: 4-hydroxy-tetrahydrodipicolinate synthase, partial [Actinomycetota bacterium]|nr:4-hydroxy-tetrahydrodipicolinate synthase [Actinomycetota bacterium]
MIPLETNALRGSYPPLVTPFRKGVVDEDAYARLVEFQAAEGSHGIVVTGTTGEPSTLTLEERARLVKVAVEAAGGRLPIVAATGSQSHAETLWLSEQAVRAGASALLVVTPYYVRPPQRGLVAYFVDLARRWDLPLLAYHIPGRTAVAMEPATIEQIAESAPTFVGMKHAQNDLGLVTEVLRRLGSDFRIFVGLEDLSLPMLAVGATGLMNAVGNLAPARVAALYEAVASGDLRWARALHDELAELNQAVFWDTNPIAIKCLMRKLGILPTNEHRLPMMPATPELEARL